MPVSGHDQTGNHCFQNTPDLSTCPGAARVRAEHARFPHPLVWISGHVRWNTATFLGGHPHVTLRSLTETFNTQPDTAGSMGALSLGETLDWTVRGADAFSFAVPAAQTARRWAAPLPPFGELPEVRRRLPAQAAE